MADTSSTERELFKAFAAYLIEIDAGGPAPDCEEQLAAINAEFDLECERVLAEEAAQTTTTVNSV